MKHVDVAIVGAGPSGSVAAYFLAKAGAEVVVLEQAAFPREKSCGDGVTSAGLDVLARMGLAEWAAAFPVFEELRFTSPDRQVLDVPLDVNDPVGRLIPRRLFDHQLVKQAVAAGAELRENSKVSSVERQAGQGAEVHTADGQSIQAKVVVLAEGSHARLTRSMGLLEEKELPELIAARQYLSGDTGITGRLEFHFQDSIIPGYTWLFPTGDGYVNIGTGTYTQRVQRKEVDLRDELERFKHDPIIEGRLEKTEPVGPPIGHPLRTQIGNTRTHVDHAVVVGDAAGLVNPFTGVGIAPGMVSGELAARQIARMLEAGGSGSADELQAYTQDLMQTFRADRKAAVRLRSWLSEPARLNRLFGKMQRDDELALLFGHIIFDKRSPRNALRLGTILKALL